MYYDRDGTPMDIHEFAEKFRDPDYKRIAQDETDGEHVSTVWLGIDYNFSGEGPPVIFETMIIGGEYNEYQWRYCTEEEAREGHERIVLALAAGNSPE